MAGVSVRSVTVLLDTQTGGLAIELAFLTSERAFCCEWRLAIMLFVVRILLCCVPYIAMKAVLVRGILLAGAAEPPGGGL